MRKAPIVTNEIYHVFNRGVNKADIFLSDEDYSQFLEAAIHYKNKNNKFSYQKRTNSSDHDPVSLQPEQGKVEVMAYCLMPNHFHLLLKQLIDGGLTSYFRHLANSYSHYINIKYQRSGPLFGGRFKSVLIESDEQLLHVSRYIHLNPLVSKIVSDLKRYKWSSYLGYVTNNIDNLANSERILTYFKSLKDYERFVHDQEAYGRELEKIKHLTYDHDTGS